MASYVSQSLLWRFSQSIPGLILILPHAFTHSRFRPNEQVDDHFKGILQPQNKCCLDVRSWLPDFRMSTWKLFQNLKLKDEIARFCCSSSNSMNTFEKRSNSILGNLTPVKTDYKQAVKVDAVRRTTARLFICSKHLCAWFLRGWLVYTQQYPG